MTSHTVCHCQNSVRTLSGRRYRRLVSEVAAAAEADDAEADDAEADDAEADGPAMRL